MRSPYCTFRDRLITLSVCVCGVLAFSTTLSANPAVFVVGTVNLGNYTPTGGVSMPVGPYPGTLTINNVVSPNSLFFCLTGNQTVQNSETGTEAGPSGQAQEEAAFLASLMLVDAAADKIGVTTSGAGGAKVVTLTQNGSVTLGTFRSTVLGPIQTAIWEIMGTLPAGDSHITDAATANFVTMAQNEWTNVLSNPANPYTQYLNNNVQVFSFTGKGQGQDFISVCPPSSVPEPGTMVLFGTGALLMALGCTRRLRARRPR